MIDPDAALSYLEFVEERHRVWEARQRGDAQPWTSNPVVATRKFTNVFRVLDHGSQYVLTDLIDPELTPREQLMLLFLYRHTGRVEVWEHLNAVFGFPAGTADLRWVSKVLKEYRGGSREITCGTTTVGGGSRKGRLFDRPLFTSAYLVFPQSATPGTDKLDSIIDLTTRLFRYKSPDDIVPDFLAAQTQAERFAVLRRNKGVADFMSMQILTDWGYTPHCGEDRENEFVVLGPGARKGAKVLDSSRPPEQTFEWARESVAGLSVSLGSRRPSWMDVQNTLCEFSKYARFELKPTPASLYKTTHTASPPVLPQHWS